MISRDNNNNNDNNNNRHYGGGRGRVLMVEFVRWQQRYVGAEAKVAA